MAFARTAIVLVLVAASCGGETTTPPTSAAVGGAGGADGAAVTISNQGGEMEGHTPTAFAGSGTGLFVGDNLNSGFPEGVGVQLFLTFTLPDDLSISRATVTSEALHISGTPFADLGDLLIEPVVYETFGPPLYELAATQDPISCEITGDATIVCDVTAATQSASAARLGSAQFRIRFDQPADDDGQQDLAMFYRTDSNTNVPGIFELQINGG